jgi:hypothetical protein
MKKTATNRAVGAAYNMPSNWRDRFRDFHHFFGTVGLDAGALGDAVDMTGDLLSGYERWRRATRFPGEPSRANRPLVVRLFSCECLASE